MEIVLRAAFIYFFLWLVIRGLGKRELAQMTPFELVLLITMGDLVQQGVTQEDMSLTGAVLAVGTLAVLVVATSYLSFKSTRFKQAVDGRPSVVVTDGRTNDDVLSAERLTTDDVVEAAREQGIGDLADVRFAVLEPGGNFSFLLREGRPDPRRKQGSTGSPA